MIKRTLLLMSTIALSLFLVACGEDVIDDFDSPSFSHLEVNDTDPGSPDDFNVFFVEKNELITIDIYLDNPSGLPINLISINGTPYRQARFEDASTSSHIILRLDVLRVPGQTEYEINEIEYTHPENGVQTAAVTNDNQFQVYVLESAPTAEFNQITTGQTALDANLNLRDPDQTIISADLVLLLDSVEVERKALSTGLHAYHFSELYSDNAYDLHVVVTYERAEGELGQENLVLNQAENIQTNAKTTPTLSLSNIMSTERAISFTLEAIDPDQTGGFSDIGLYQDGTRMHTFTHDTDLSVTDLLSDTTYEIYVEYTYDLNDQSGHQTIILTDTVTTDDLQAPTVTIENLSTTEDSVGFDVLLEDLDDTLTSDFLTIELLKDDELIHTQQVSLDALSGIMFTDLLSDSHYAINVNATFDLNDQHASQTGTLSTHSFATNPVTLPDVNVSTNTVSESRLVFTIDTSAVQPLLTDEVLHIHFYDTETNRLLRSAQLIQDTLTLEVKDMLANQSVRLEITGTYDLNDGLGSRTDVIYTNTYQTTTNRVPTGQVSSVTFEQEGITFNYNLTDGDNTLVPGTFIAIIYEDNGSELIELDVIVLDPSETEYTYDYAPKAAYSYGVKLLVDYDLRDGQGVTQDHSLNALYVVTDLHDKAPTASLFTSHVGEDTITVDYDILDIDNTISDITLALDGDAITITDLEGSETFDGLEAQTIYTFTLTITYEHKGETETLVLEETFTTE